MCIFCSYILRQKRMLEVTNKKHTEFVTFGKNISLY